MLADPRGTELRGAVARRMWRAVRPFAGRHPIAPIVARDGALAEEILGAVSRARPCSTGPSSRSAAASPFI